MSKKIAITTSSFAKHDTKPLDLLKTEGFETVKNMSGRKLEKKEILEFCNDSIGIIAGTEIYDSDVLKGLGKVKAISRCGVGMENIDIDFANSLGIKILNTPDAPTLSVAELTMGLILNLLRKVNQMDTGIRGNKWEKLMGNLLFGKKIGIIGFGRIGRKVGELVSGFGTELAYCDTETKMPPAFNCSKKDLEAILGWADIITLHLSAAKVKGPIIGSKEIDLMKKGSWFINVSRGGVVDEEALYRALKNNYLSGAALDVFEKEPYKGLLKELDNVILTPHIGSYAKEARIKMEVEAVENLIKNLQGEEK